MPRPPRPLGTDDMLKAARFYYKQGKSKKEIAGLLFQNGDIRPVTQLLDQAQKQGIVEIYIHDTIESGLEDILKAKFPHLQRVLIVPGRRVTTPDQYSDLQRQWGRLAANYFEEIWGQHPADTPLHVGVSGGDHLAHFANAVTERIRENVYVHVTALIGRGRLDPATSHIDPIVTASILWSQCGRRPGQNEYATVSPYVTDGPGPAARRAVREELDKIAANTAVREVLKAMDDLDVVFASIGIVNPGRVKDPALRGRMTMSALLQGIITPEQLEKEEAVGDFSYCLFDAKGNSPKPWQFFLTAGHDSPHQGVAFFRHMVEKGKKVVALGGPYKIPAIKVALKAKIFNVWVTDEASAREIADA